MKIGVRKIEKYHSNSIRMCAINMKHSILFNNTEANNRLHNSVQLGNLQLPSFNLYIEIQRFIQLNLPANGNTVIPFNKNRR